MKNEEIQLHRERKMLKEIERKKYVPLIGRAMLLRKEREREDIKEKEGTCVAECERNRMKRERDEDSHRHHKPKKAEGGNLFSS